MKGYLGFGTLVGGRGQIGSWGNFDIEINNLVEILQLFQTAGTQNHTPRFIKQLMISDSNYGKVSKQDL